MANIDAPSGFKLVSWSMQNPIRRCYFKGGANLFIGDIVKADVSQESAAFVDGIAPGAMAVEVIGATSDTPCGVMLGKHFVDPDADHTIPYAVASTECYVDVCIDPDAVFEVQADDSTLAYAKIGLNADPVLTTGNTTTGYSNHELDASTLATTNTLMLQVIDIVPTPDNALGAYGKVMVKFNEHYFAKVRTGVS